MSFQILNWLLPKKPRWWLDSRLRHVNDKEGLVGDRDAPATDWRCASVHTGALGTRRWAQVSVGSSGPKRGYQPLEMTFRDIMSLVQDFLLFTFKLFSLFVLICDGTNLKRTLRLRGRSAPGGRRWESASICPCWHLRGSLGVLPGTLWIWKPRFSSSN